MSRPLPSHLTDQDRAALAYEAGQDLWRAVDALDAAHTKLRQTGTFGIQSIHANKLMADVGKLANKVEEKTDGLFEAQS